MPRFRRVVAFKRETVLVGTTGESVFFLATNTGGDPRPRIRLADFSELRVGEYAIVERLIVFPGSRRAAASDGRYLYRFDASGGLHDLVDVTRAGTQSHKRSDQEVVWLFGATVEHDTLLFWLTERRSGSADRVAGYEFEQRRLISSESQSHVWAPCCASRREQIAYVWSNTQPNMGRLIVLRMPGEVVREYQLPIEYDYGALSSDEGKLALWTTIAKRSGRPAILDLRTGEIKTLGQSAASVAWLANGTLLLFQNPGKILLCDPVSPAYFETVFDVASTRWWQQDFEWNRSVAVSEDYTWVAASIKTTGSLSHAESYSATLLIDLDRSEYRLTRDFYSVGWMQPE